MSSGLANGAIVSELLEICPAIKNVFASWAAFLSSRTPMVPFAKYASSRADASLQTRTQGSIEAKFALWLVLAGGCGVRQPHNPMPAIADAQKQLKQFI